MVGSTPPEMTRAGRRRARPDRGAWRRWRAVLCVALLAALLPAAAGPAAAQADDVPGTGFNTDAEIDLINGAGCFPGSRALLQPRARLDADDIDRVKVELKQDQTYVFEVRGRASGGGRIWDPELSGVYVQESENGAYHPDRIDAHPYRWSDRELEPDTRIVGNGFSRDDQVPLYSTIFSDESDNDERFEADRFKADGFDTNYHAYDLDDGIGQDAWMLFKTAANTTTSEQDHYLQIEGSGDSTGSYSVLVYEWDGTATNTADKKKAAEDACDTGEGSPKLSRESLALVEGDRNEYRIRLPARPSGTVTVNLVVSPDPMGNLMVRTSLEFTTQNWALWRTVEVLAPTDSNKRGGTFTIKHKATGGGYDKATGGEYDHEAELTVSVTDLDTTPSSAPLNLEVIAGNEQATARWDRPADDGGYNIEGYEIVKSNIPDKCPPSVVDKDPVAIPDPNDTPKDVLDKAIAYWLGLAGSANLETLPARGESGRAQFIDDFWDALGEWREVGQGERSYTWTGLENGEESTFCVRAVTKRGRGAYADPNQATPVPLSFSIEEFAPGSVDEGDSAKFLIKSMHPADETYINLHYSYRGDFAVDPKPKESRGPLTGTGPLMGTGPWVVEVETEDDTTIEPDGSVTVRIKPGDGYSIGDPASATVEVTDNDDGQVPGPPRSLSLSAASSTSLLAQWLEPSDRGIPSTGLEYFVQYRLVESHIPMIWVETTADGTETTLEGLTAGEEYEVRVRAGNARGLGPWSDTVPKTTLTKAVRFASVAAVPDKKTGANFAYEGTTLVFKVSVDPEWTSAADPRQVRILVTESGDALKTPLPSTVNFAVEDDVAEVRLPTVDDRTAEEMSIVTVTVLPSSGYEDYEVEPREDRASMTVVDNDELELAEGEDGSPVIERTAAIKHETLPLWAMFVYWVLPDGISDGQIRRWMVEWALGPPCEYGADGALSTEPYGPWKNSGSSADSADKTGIRESSVRWRISGESVYFRVTAMFTTGSKGPPSSAVCQTAPQAYEAGPPLTVSFHVPEFHGGLDTHLPLDIVFSEPVDAGRAVLREALHIEGGTLQSVYHADTNTWAILVRPTSDESVTVTLEPQDAADGTCERLCTQDGRGLSEPVSVTVSGP